MYHLEINSFNVELVSNASFDCYSNKTLSSSTNFLPEQINLEGEWEVPITKLSYPSLYQNITEGKFFYLDEATPNTKPLHYYTIDPDLYPLVSDIVHNEMNKKIRNLKSMKKHQSDYTLKNNTANFFEFSQREFFTCYIYC